MKKVLRFAFLMFVSSAVLIGCKQEVEPDPVIEEQKEEQPTTDEPTTETGTSDDENENGNGEESNLPQSFARKQLIEHFTGQTCGYCPYGMASIAEEIAKKEKSYIWVSNHAGYSDDSYTITGSKRLANKYGVTGAPSMMLNREKFQFKKADADAKYSDWAFHPAVIGNYTSGLSEEAPISVEIKSEAENADNYKIEVSGVVLGEQGSLKLTVVVKENGLHGTQSDYLDSWEGWDDFVHNNVVRKFLSSWEGDAVEVTAEGTYSKSYSLPVDSKWQKENCQIVAYITNESDVVVNAEEIALVENTTGGADIAGGGVTRTAVPDTYPEVGAVPAAGTAVEYSVGGYFVAQTAQNGLKLMEVQLYSTTQSTYQGVNVLPFADLLFVVSSDAVGVPNGTYNLLTSFEGGTAVAGYKDEENYSINGSMFYMARVDYFSQGYLQGWKWLLSSGKVVVSDAGISYQAKTLSGSTVRGSFTGQLANYDYPQAPIRRVRKEK